jgi:protein-arginine kinase activator protein McsA
MPTIDLTDAELGAVAAAIRGVVETDKQKVCASCGAAFTAVRTSTKFCSAVCRQRAHRAAAIADQTSAGEV